jgi:hypothetical protein
MLTYVRFKVLAAVTMKFIVLHDMAPPCSLIDRYQRFEGFSATIFLSSTLKVEASCSSETFACICQTKRRHTPDDSNLNINLP